MFSWGRGNKVEEAIKPETPVSWLLEIDDLDQYKDRIAVMCIKKCLNDPDEPALNSAQRVCLNRCAYKFVSSVNYMNKACGFLELKVDKFQQSKVTDKTL